MDISAVSSLKLIIKPEISIRYDGQAQHLQALNAWMIETLSQLDSSSKLADAFNYSLKRWKQLCRYTEDGRLEIDNGAAERSIRGMGIGRRNYLFFGSDSGGERAAIIYSLVESCKLALLNFEWVDLWLSMSAWRSLLGSVSWCLWDQCREVCAKAVGAKRCAHSHFLAYWLSVGSRVRFAGLHFISPALDPAPSQFEVRSTCRRPRLIAVGTRIATCPPHKTERAPFGHSASTSGA